MLAVMERAAERQLERHALDERDVPSEARVELAGVAVDVDRCTNVKAGPQGDIGDVAAVGDGGPAEKDLDVNILTALLGPGRLDMVPEKPEANLVEDRSRPGIVLRLGRQAAGDNERGQKNEREHHTAHAKFATQSTRETPHTVAPEPAIMRRSGALEALLGSISARRTGVGDHGARPSGDRWC